MYIYMGHMKYEHTKPYEDWFWGKNRIELKKGWVRSIDFNQKSLFFEGGETLFYDKLVLALGSKSNTFGCPGQDLAGVQGLYSYQDLEAMEASTKSIQRAVVVGGGLIGIEMAEMLHSRGIPVVARGAGTGLSGGALPLGDGIVLSLARFNAILKVNDKLKLVPGHCDPTCNVHDWYVGVRGGKVETVWPVSARGKAY